MPFGQTVSPYADQRGQAALAAYQQAYNKALPTVQSDLNAGNFGGAFQAAEGITPQTSYTGDVATPNTLLEQLTSAQGLQQIDPSMQWTPQSIQSYYSAAMAPSNWSAITANPNPYGAQNTAWGDAGKASQDAQANIAQSGSAPDLGRFAGYNAANNSDLFSNIVGAVTQYAPTLMLAAAAPEALPAIAGELGVGGTALAGALYGAGSGAFTSGVNGGNMLKGALTGALTGGLQGSGLVKNLVNDGRYLMTDV